ncbi:MAG TPA: response regulator [Thermoanaerobaculia bacterium]|nr:response regulator [Thermoanaerobaculia bacterium]
MILVVEDDPQVSRLIALVLQRNGYKAETVTDGNSALEKVRADLPQLVFADLTIRGMNGADLCIALKAEEATREIPFIVVSGDRDIAEKALSCGANDHLGKPFEFDDLIRLVKKYVKDHSS